MYDSRAKAALGRLNYPLQRLRKPANCFITCSGKRDGPGAQIQAVMSTMLFAREVGFEYVHTPFASVSHAPPGSPRWHEEWEAFANLGEGETRADDPRVARAAVRRVEHPASIWKRPDTLFVVQHCHSFADQAPDRYAGVIDQFVARYERVPKQVPLHALPGKLNVAVHVRRGDVSRRGSAALRYTSDEYVLRVVAAVLAAAREAGLPAAAHLYSEGRDEDFAEFAARGFSLHVSESPFTTLHNLVRADVLLMARSSFSYAAALLSCGIRVYEPFWHKPMSSWLVAGPNGELNERMLRQALLRHAAAPR